MAGTSGVEELRELWTFGRCGFPGDTWSRRDDGRENRNARGAGVVRQRVYAEDARGGSAGMASEV